MYLLRRTPLVLIVGLLLVMASCTTDTVVSPEAESTETEAPEQPDAKLAPGPKEKLKEAPLETAALPPGELLIQVNEFGTVIADTTICIRSLLGGSSSDRCGESYADNDPCESNGYNWFAFVPGGDASCSNISGRLELHETYVVWAKYGTTGKKLIGRWHSVSSNPDIFLSDHDPMTISSTPGNADGFTETIDLDDFDEWGGEHTDDDELTVGSTVYTLDWGPIESLGVNAAEYIAPPVGPVDLTVVGTLSGSTIKVYDYEH